MRRASLFIAALLWSAAAAPQSVYFGNLHSHTSYSDGRGTPAQAYARARSAGLDFFALTEHNHDEAMGSDRRGIATMPQLYSGQASSLVETADRLNAPGSFVTIYGQEVSTISKGNHINIFGVGSVVKEADVANGDVPALLNWARSHPDAAGLPALLQFNHPHNPEDEDAREDYGRDDFEPSKWVSSVDPLVELIEVMNAPALKPGDGHRAHAKEGYYFSYLDLGFHVGPSVGHDNHFENWGTSTDARVGVIAPALTREAIMAALRARHTFVTDDKNLKVIFRSGNNLAGDILSAPVVGSELPLSVEIKDGDQSEANARYEIDVLVGIPGVQRAKRVERFAITGNTQTPKKLEGVRFEREGQFVLLRISQVSTAAGDSEHDQEDRVWTAPIWYEASVPSPVTVARIRIAELLPNPSGDEFQNEQITLHNEGGTQVSLSGWQLRDASGNSWVLIGTLNPGQRIVFPRNRQAMSLNNDGDLVQLFDATGELVDSGHYQRASEGQTVTLERP